jgi:hypothetical protein
MAAATATLVPDVLLTALSTVLLHVAISPTIVLNSSASLTSVLPHLPIAQATGARLALAAMFPHLPIARAFGAHIRVALSPIVPHLPIALALGARLALAPILSYLPAAFAIRVGLALPATILNLPLVAVPSRACAIRQRSGDDVVITRPAAVSITRPVAVCPVVFMPLVGMLLPVGVPIVAVAIPASVVIPLAIISVPVVVEFEYDHRECDQRGVVRQIDALRLVDCFDVIGRDPAAGSVPSDITPGPIRQTAYDRHRVARGDQVYDGIGRVRAGTQVYVRGGVTLGLSRRRRSRR